VTSDELVGEHHGLALHLADSWALRYPKADRDDLVSDAQLGLLEAARSWDPATGVTFQGYARRVIRWRLTDGFRERLGRKASTRNVRQPVSLDALEPVARRAGAVDVGFEHVEDRLYAAATLEALGLTPSEHRVLVAIGTGGTLRAAADELALSEGRVCQIRQGIRARLLRSALDEPPQRPSRTTCHHPAMT
jgi:RNA polymerase sigma factor (sigma-70 family)